MKTIKNKTVLVTGGASGMGKAYVQKAIESKAANIIIWDIDPLLMEQVVKENEDHLTGINIYTFKVDVTDTSLVYKTADLILKEIGRVDLLINNAGIVISKPFEDSSPENIDLIMDVNAKAPMHIVRAFLPEMIKSNDAHIVNIASGAAYMYCPKIITYCSSKWAVLGWSLGLSTEMQEKYPHVHVTTVTPGHIDTGMFENAHSSLVPLITVDKMVDAVWSGILKNKELIARPRRVNIVPIIRALSGVKGWNWLARVTGTNDFMAG
ncbi:SDR family NAD(P)-dependent oxidoreductase [Flammeovirga sp. SubArs3]|uniref:SDR family NAD(P)-dependent oxidoreductase n=1 Tax=Flammeovirga sp. SubArs3 TaxID=2995316 RepID=UPI00248CB58D|nr:SDR family NAD(P)-dependent oxidoreductase [Flammeovirga sp. SubArs3]